MKKVYLAGPIAGLSFEECNTWREWAIKDLDPFIGVSPLRPDMHGRSFYHKDIPTAVKFDRDYQDVMSCDAILVNLHGATRPSVGTIMEIGWAFMRRIPIVVVMEQDNVHNHLFITQSVSQNPVGFIEPNLAYGIFRIKEVLS